MYRVIQPLISHLTHIDPGICPEVCMFEIPIPLCRVHRCVMTFSPSSRYVSRYSTFLSNHKQDVQEENCFFPGELYRSDRMKGLGSRRVVVGAMRAVRL